jgi:hypothetical protein
MELFCAGCVAATVARDVCARVSVGVSVFRLWEVLTFVFAFEANTPLKTMTTSASTAVNRLCHPHNTPRIAFNSLAKDQRHRRGTNISECANGFRSPAKIAPF